MDEDTHVHSSITTVLEDINLEVVITDRREIQVNAAKVTIDYQRCILCVGTGQLLVVPDTGSTEDAERRDCPLCKGDGSYPTLGSIRRTSDILRGQVAEIEGYIKECESALSILRRKDFDQYLYDVALGHEVDNMWIMIDATGVRRQPAIEGKVALIVIGKQLATNRVTATSTGNVNIAEFGDMEYTDDRVPDGFLPEVGTERCIALVDVPKGVVGTEDIKNLRESAITWTSTRVDRLYATLFERTEEFEKSLRIMRDWREWTGEMARKIKAARDGEPREAPAPQKVEEVRCVECGKHALVQDDDGRWYCKKHAYPLGLLDRPKVDEAEADETPNDVEPTLPQVGSASSTLDPHLMTPGERRRRGL
jgi:hypothetical protein